MSRTRTFISVIFVLALSTTAFVEPAMAQAEPLMQLTGRIERTNSRQAIFIIERIFPIKANGKLAGHRDSDLVSCPTSSSHGRTPESARVAVGDAIPLRWSEERDPGWRRWLPRRTIAVRFDLPKHGWDRACGRLTQQIQVVFVHKTRRARSLRLSGKKAGRLSPFARRSILSAFAAPKKFEPIRTSIRIAWDGSYSSTASEAILIEF